MLVANEDDGLLANGVASVVHVATGVEVLSTEEPSRPPRAAP